MARTKQTARKSIGEKVPRKQFDEDEDFGLAAPPLGASTKAWRKLQHKQALIQEQGYSAFGVDPTYMRGVSADEQEDDEEMEFQSVDSEQVEDVNASIEQANDEEKLMQQEENERIEKKWDKMELISESSSIAHADVNQVIPKSDFLQVESQESFEEGEEEMDEEESKEKLWDYPPYLQDGKKEKERAEWKRQKPIVQQMQANKQKMKVSRKKEKEKKRKVAKIDKPPHFSISVLFH